MRFQIFNFVLAIFFLSLSACDKDDCEEHACNGNHSNRQDPVCGCNGKTYQSAEWAECHGIEDYTPGPCGEDD